MITQHKGIKEKAMVMLSQQQPGNAFWPLGFSRRRSVEILWDFKVIQEVGQHLRQTFGCCLEQEEKGGSIYSTGPYCSFSFEQDMPGTA